VRELGAHLESQLRSLRERHGSIGRISGRGLCYSVDLVGGDGQPVVPEDRYFHFVGDVSQNPNNLVAAECFKRGVYLGGFVPNTIKVAPPFTITEGEIDFAMEALDHALSVVEERYGVPSRGSAA
jgi:taurine--2-oxoglutarate transaminase